MDSIAYCFDFYNMVLDVNDPDQMMLSCIDAEEVDLRTITQKINASGKLNPKNRSDYQQ